MCSDILISLHPRHCDNLVSGRKTVELRRRKMAVQPGTRVWIYSTHPRACVEACAIVDGVFSGSHDELWNAFGDKVAVSRCEFDHYFAGTTDAHAIVLREGCSSESFHQAQRVAEKTRWVPPTAVLQEA